MSGPRRVRRRSRSRRQIPAWLVRTMAGLTAAAILAGGGVYLFTLVQGRWDEISERLDPGNRLDLSYLPPDANSIIVVRPAAVRGTGSARAYIDSAGYREQRAPAWELLGLSPDEISTATWAAVDFDLPLDRVLAGRAAADSFVSVIRTYEPVSGVSPSEPLQAGEDVNIGSQRYSRITATTHDGTESTLALFTPDSRTIVFGTEELVRTAAQEHQQGAPAPRRYELDFVNPEHHLVVVAIADSGAGRTREAGTSAIGYFPQALVDVFDAVDNLPDSYSLGMTFLENELYLEALCRFDNDSHQAALVTRLEMIVSEAGAELAARREDDDSSRNWELREAGQQALDRFQVQSHPDSLSITTSVPLERLARRKLLRMHAASMAPFSLALERVPRQMLGLETVTTED